MDDVEQKSECLQVPKMTTVLTEWRLDKQQQGKVNSEGGKTKTTVVHLGNV